MMHTFQRSNRDQYLRVNDDDCKQYSIAVCTPIVAAAAAAAAANVASAGASASAASNSQFSPEDEMKTCVKQQLSQYRKWNDNYGPYVHQQSQHHFTDLPADGYDYLSIMHYPFSQCLMPRFPLQMRQQLSEAENQAMAVRMVTPKANRPAENTLPEHFQLWIRQYNQWRAEQKHGAELTPFDVSSINAAYDCHIAPVEVRIEWSAAVPLKPVPSGAFLTHERFPHLHPAHSRDAVQAAAALRADLKASQTAAAHVPAAAAAAAGTAGDVRSFSVGFVFRVMVGRQWTIARFKADALKRAGFALKQRHAEEKAATCQLFQLHVEHTQTAPKAGAKVAAGAASASVTSASAASAAEPTSMPMDTDSTVSQVQPVDDRTLLGQINLSAAVILRCQ